MGMYDELICKVELPRKEWQDLIYQTKDTPSQFLDRYEIRQDGSLWYEEYDIEDRSDKTKPEGSLSRLAGMMTRVNQRAKQVTDFTGEIRFYTDHLGKWIEFSAYFANGILSEMHQISPQPGDRVA